MKFYDLSPNSIIIIDEMLKNDRLVNLIGYDNLTPYSSPVVAEADKGSLVMSRIFPIPVTGDIAIEKHTEVRVFFPQGDIKNKKIMGNVVVFQIITHSDLWLIKDGDEKRIRPYDIMHEIVEVFENKSHGTLGVLHFMDYKYIRVNKDFSGYELIADMMTIG